MHGSSKPRVQLLDPGDAECGPAPLSQRSQQSQLSWTSPQPATHPAVSNVRLHTSGDARIDVHDKQRDLTSPGRDSEYDTDFWPTVTFLSASAPSMSFAEEQKELEVMWNTTSINKFYMPISKLPPLRGDPRLRLGHRSPACYKDRSVPRAHRIMQRWQSMPQLPAQLRPEHLRAIELADDMATSKTGKMGALPGRARRQSAMLREGIMDRRRDAEAQDPSRSPEPKEYPHIPCKCCEHPRPKPWLDKRSVGAATAVSMAAAVAPSRSVLDDGVS